MGALCRYQSSGQHGSAPRDGHRCVDHRGRLVGGGLQHSLQGSCAPITSSRTGWWRIAAVRTPQSLHLECQIAPEAPIPKATHPFLGIYINPLPLPFPFSPSFQQRAASRGLTDGQSVCGRSLQSNSQPWRSKLARARGNRLLIAAKRMRAARRGSRAAVGANPQQCASCARQAACCRLGHAWHRLRVTGL